MLFSGQWNDISCVLITLVGDLSYVQMSKYELFQMLSASHVRMHRKIIWVISTGLFPREGEVDDKVLWFVNRKLLIDHLKTWSSVNFTLSTIPVNNTFHLHCLASMLVTLLSSWHLWDNPNRTTVFLCHFLTLLFGPFLSQSPWKLLCTAISHSGM